MAEEIKQVPICDYRRAVPGRRFNRRRVVVGTFACLSVYVAAWLFTRAAMTTELLSSDGGVNTIRRDWTGTPRLQPLVRASRPLFAPAEWLDRRLRPSDWDRTAWLVPLDD